RVIGEDELFVYFKSETPGFESFAVTGRKQSELVQSYSSKSSQANPPEKVPDGAPEVWITRENEDNSTEENGEDNRSIPSVSFGICIILLLAGTLWIKRK
ncbi:MAG TPA: hypothetical protein HA306_01375, partial [Methanosarcina sp.]|nr:hypothetical protein [Methanosarcina sp.]